MTAGGAVRHRCRLIGWRSGSRDTAETLLGVLTIAVDGLELYVPLRRDPATGELRLAWFAARRARGRWRRRDRELDQAVRVATPLPRGSVHAYR